MRLSTLKSIFKKPRQIKPSASDGVIAIDNSFCSLEQFSPEAIEIVRSTLTYDNQEAIYEIQSLKISLSRAFRYKKLQKVRWMKAKIEQLEQNIEICWLRDNRFPTGHLNLVTAALEEEQISFKVEDRRKNKAQKIPLPWKARPMEPRYFQKEMLELGLKHHRGVFESAVGCHAAGQLILMFNGELRCVEDIRVGDQLMGPDSTPRNVLRLFSGRDEMYEISPVKGEPFTVNKAHILSLQRTALRTPKPYNRKFQKARARPGTGNPIVNIAVADFLAKRSHFQMNHKLYRVGVEFQQCEPLAIPPYLLGAWLGDGHSSGFHITTMDQEIKDEWQAFVRSHDNVFIRRIAAGAAYTYLSQVKNRTYKLGARFCNPLNLNLHNYDLLNNKHIPRDYKVASRASRLELLAGLIDTDGYVNRNCVDLVQKNKVLADDIVFLARSLGFAAYCTPCRKTCANNGVAGDYFRISISGDLSPIPVRIRRKRSPFRNQSKCVLRTGFTVKKISDDGQYFGFEVDGDNLYLLGDFTVTHNSGKTHIMQLLTHAIGVPTLIVCPSKDLAVQTYDSFVGAFGESKVELVSSAKSGHRKAIRVCTVQTLSAFQKKGFLELLLTGIGMVCIDEVHHAGAQSYSNLLPYFDGIYYRFGFSGTFMRNDSRTLDMWGFLSTVLYKYSAAQATAEGFLTPLKVLVHEIEGVKAGTYQTEYTRNYCDNAELLLAIKAILSSCSDEEQVLILVGRKEKSGHIIKAFLDDLGITSEYVSGDSKRDHVRTALQDFNAKKFRVLVGSTIIGEGIDVRSTDHLIMAQGGKSEIAITQAVGRAVRLYKDKEVAFLHDFRFLGTKYLEKHLERRLEIYQKNFDGEILC